MIQKGYVLRAGMKLKQALRESGVDVTGVDFGGDVGGFTDCRRQHGAAKVYAIDTGYGVLDYRLRTDDRGLEMERMNVLHVLRTEDHPPSERAGFEGTLAEQRAAEALQRVLGR